MTQEELLAFARLIEAGIKEGVAEALEEHRLLGRKVAIWRDGKIELVLPEPRRANGAAETPATPPPAR